MRLETLDRFPTELDAIAHRSTNATFYHTSPWLESVAKCFSEWKMRCTIARSGDDVLGYLPFFVVVKGRMQRCLSLPFGTYGGPVVEDEEIAGKLAGSFTSLRNTRGVHEVSLVDFFNDVDAPGVSSESYVAHIVDLSPGFGEIWAKRFNQSKRRQARKAGREGMTVTETSAGADVSAYYAVYRERSEEWKQSFVYPEALFTELVTRHGGDVRLFVARLGGEVLGGLLNFYFRDMVIAWHGATVRSRHGSLASTLLYSTCIRHACENGYRGYNLGSSVGKGSLAHYKEVLGGVEHSYRVVRWRSRSLAVATAARRLLRSPGRR